MDTVLSSCHRTKVTRVPKAGGPLIFSKAKAFGVKWKIYIEVVILFKIELGMIWVDDR
jgi:hypothetical protein